MSAAPATTLVIDDEGMVRQLVRRMLEPEVCRVLEAADGEAGLRLIERSREAIDLVLTDLLMPGIDGYDVVEVLAAHRPGLPVVCMSGFASHVSVTSVGRRIPVPFIPKPFTVESLRLMLEPLLAARGGAAPARVTADPSDAEGADLVAAAHDLRRRRASGGQGQ